MKYKIQCPKCCEYLMVELDENKMGTFPPHHDKTAFINIYPINENGSIAWDRGTSGNMYRLCRWSGANIS